MRTTFLRTLLVVAGATAALAGPTSSDPIIGVYEGKAFYENTVTIGGVTIEAGTGQFDDPCGLDFAADHTGQAFTVPTTWSKKGAKYRMKGKAPPDLADAQAKNSVKCKKIELLPGGEITGEFKLKQQFTQDLFLVKHSIVGVFACTPVP